MEKHCCQEDRRCLCGITALAPRHNCPVHGDGPYLPHCGICGRFIRRRAVWGAQMSPEDPVRLSCRVAWDGGWIWECWFVGVTRGDGADLTMRGYSTEREAQEGLDRYLREDPNVAITP